MKNILVADDNPAILDALSIMLEEEGYAVETTEDGAVARDMKAPLPDLLLLDVWMSGIDGRDICKHLKSVPATSHVPIIMISATKGLEQIAKKAGANDFISKPFQMDHLLDVVAAHMSKPKKIILIVDDDADIRNSIRLAVEEQDHVDIEVIESSNVSAGLKQLETFKPDIVILDIHMPGKSGFDFMDIVHKSNRSINSKVIMLSADDTLMNIFKGESKGIDAHYFLAKPFNISDLQALVLSLCLPLKA